MNTALATLLSGEKDKAAEMFDSISKSGLYSTDPRENTLASFFVEVSRILKKPDELIQSSIATLYSTEGYDGFALFCFAAHDWHCGRLKDAGPLFQGFIKSSDPVIEKWITAYKPLAEAYYEEYTKLRPIEEGLANVKDPASAKALLDKARQAREQVPADSKVLERLDAIEADLIAKGAK